MKFNKYFTQEIIPEWKYFYTDYYSLKTMIKQQESQNFMSLMKKELEKVNQFVDIIQKYDKNNDNLNSFIVMNYMAFFKAIKKYDKRLCKTYKSGFFSMMKKQPFYKSYINTPRKCQKIKLIIFDKDGTLINHDKLFIPWFKAVIHNMEPIIPNINEVYKYLGYIEKENRFLSNSVVARGTNDDIRNSITEYIIQNSETDIKTVRTYINKYWKEPDFNDKDLETYGNLVNIFAEIRNMNIKIAICTSDDRNPTNKMIELTGINDFIDIYVCGNDHISSKPSPEPIWKICHKLNIKPSETIMVGDTMSDLHAGINARCGKIISVLTGGYTCEELNNADIIAKDVTEISDIVKNINYEFDNEPSNLHQT